MKSSPKQRFDGAATGVTVCFGLISVLVFWMGMMKMAEDAGLLGRIAKLLGPAVRFLFPDVPKDHPAMGYILSNMSANLLGLGNAATPMGIKAMRYRRNLTRQTDSFTSNVHAACPEYRQYYNYPHHLDCHPLELSICQRHRNCRHNINGYHYCYTCGHYGRPLVSKPSITQTATGIP